MLLKNNPNLFPGNISSSFALACETIFYLEITHVYGTTQNGVDTDQQGIGIFNSMRNEKC